MCCLQSAARLMTRGQRTVVTLVVVFFAVTSLVQLLLFDLDLQDLQIPGDAADELGQMDASQKGLRMEPRPDIPPLDGVWQTVNGTRDKFEVYSAFVDRRSKRDVVRVIGATRTKWPEHVWCRLWYHSRSLTVRARVKAIHENWRLRYSACFVLCPLWRNQTAPESVSVLSGQRAEATNHLLVHGDPDPDVQTLGMSVCVKPLHYHYNKPLQMLEFLELYSLLGIHHFTLYNHTIGPEVACVLEDYMSRGTVTMFPWQLNMVSQKEIRTEGLFAALNDCLYRSMYHYSYVVLVDLDEYIMPRYNDTLQDLIKLVDDDQGTDSSCYVFQNAFFYLQWEDDAEVLGSDDVVEKSLTTLRKTRRRAELHPHKKRSKYLCRPEHVVEAGNHFPWQLLARRRTLKVLPRAATLHHYRVCEFGGDDCVKTDPSLVDRTAHHYRERLVARVSGRWRQLRRRCGLPADPSPLPVA